MDIVGALDEGQRISGLYEDERKSIERRGRLGVARFADVFDALMPVQKEKLRSVCGVQFNDLNDTGSIVSIAMAYDEKAIRSINQKTDLGIDIETWNIYAREYDALNQALNSVAAKLANEFHGIALPATWSEATKTKARVVSDYFGRSISHRAVAELAGMGWRGKNSLIVNRDLSCAIRFASIVVPAELECGQPETHTCGDCTACEDACGYLRNRAILSDYRNYCWRYINYLRRNGVEYDVCGKCVKACYFDSDFSSQFDIGGERF